MNVTAPLPAANGSHQGYAAEGWLATMSSRWLSPGATGEGLIIRYRVPPAP